MHKRSSDTFLFVCDSFYIKDRSLRGKRGSGRQKLCFVDNCQWPKYSYFQRPADSKGKDKRVTTIYTHTRATHTHTHSMLCVKKTLVGDETDTRHRTKHTHDIVQCTINSTHVFWSRVLLGKTRVNSKYRATLIEVYTHTH